jgi:trehalose/maltose hydrolase-like predicted phosphorylase
VVASAVGYAEPALPYFRDACAVDLLDTHGNTANGIHSGGTWLALVAGFGGLRDFDGELRFHPSSMTSLMPPEGTDQSRRRLAADFSIRADVPSRRVEA